jgi:hypothetical protein
MTMKIGAAMAAAANRITAANSAATLKITSERQYWTRLMRPLAPNRNSNGSSMIALHTKAPANRHPEMCHPETKAGSRQTKRLNRSEA